MGLDHKQVLPPLITVLQKTDSVKEEVKKEKKVMELNIKPFAAFSLVFVVVFVFLRIVELH